MKKSTLRLLDILAALKCRRLLRYYFASKAYSSRKQDRGMLFEAKHAKELLREAIEEWPLSKSELDKLLDLSLELVAQYIAVWKDIPSIEKLSTHPRAKEILSAFTAFKSLSEEGELLMLSLPDNEELVRNYIRNYAYALRGKAELKLLDYPQFRTQKFITLCARLDRLGEEAQLKLFSLPEAEMLVKAYTEKRKLTGEAERKLFFPPYDSEILPEYLETYGCDDENDDVLLAHPQAVKLFSIVCEQYNFNEATQLAMLDHPDAGALMQVFLQTENLEEKAQLKLFEPTVEADLLPRYIALGEELSPAAQRLLFKRPDASALLEEYIRHNQLADTAQLMLFKLPNAEDLLKKHINRYPLCETALVKILHLDRWLAASLMSRYAAKYELPDKIKSLLAARSAFA